VALGKEAVMASPSRDSRGRFTADRDLARDHGQFVAGIVSQLDSRAERRALSILGLPITAPETPTPARQAPMGGATCTSVPYRNPDDEAEQWIDGFFGERRTQFRQKGRDGRWHPVNDHLI
jgi:hypothetical protein